MKPTLKALRGTLCLLLCLCLCGCTAAPDAVPALTMPPMQSGPAAPLGDGNLQYTADVTLYLPSRDGSSLLPTQETVSFTLGQHPAQAMVQALLRHPGNAQSASLGGTVELTLASTDPVLVTSGVCTVNLSASALLLSSEALYTAAQAISATLCTLDDISTVTLMISGTPAALDVSGNLPLGAVMPAAGADLPTLWKQFDAQRAPVGTLASSAPVTAQAVLFFPLADGSGVAAETRRIAFPGQHPQQLITTLMEALSQGALALEDAAPMPEILSQMVFMPEIEELEGGGRRATLHFSADFLTLLERTGCDPLCFFAALTMTLTTFVPGLQQLSILLGNDALTALPSPVHGERVFPGALHTREHYLPLVLDRVTLALPREGKLVQQSAALYFADADSPRALLLALSAAGALPALTPADILGIALKDDTLLINLSSQAEAAIRASSADQRLMAYSAVNTLCTAFPIRRVRFYFAGTAVDSLGADLLWSGEFLYNPALGEE